MNFHRLGLALAQGKAWLTQCCAELTLQVETDRAQCLTSSNSRESMSAKRVRAGGAYMVDVRLAVKQLGRSMRNDWLMTKSETVIFIAGVTLLAGAVLATSLL